MVNKPKAVGTSAETAVVRALQKLGFPHAERRALAGTKDLGDITGCPGIVWEVKGGQAAKDASDAQIGKWLTETEVERTNASADVGVLVLQRRGIGAPNAHRWWAITPAVWIPRLLLGDFQLMASETPRPDLVAFPVRMPLLNACALLRAAGYGEPLEGGA